MYVLPETEEERIASALPADPPPYARPLPPAVSLEHARREADAMIDLLHEFAASGEVVVARDIGDVESAIAGGPVAAILHFEGAEPINADLSSLEAFYARGLRSLGLVWSRPNAFAEGVARASQAACDTAFVVGTKRK